jgi:crossover junction endodeoxyribonuclease RuvC
MIILGVDPSTVATGWCVLDDGKLTDYGEIKCQSRWPMSRKMKTIFVTLTDVVQQHAPDYIACETQFKGRFASAVIAVSQAKGVVELVAGLNDVDVVGIAPTHHKKVFTGSGKASKKRTVKVAQDSYDVDGISNNIADAISIAYTCHITGGTANGDIQGISGHKAKSRRTKGSSRA